MSSEAAKDCKSITDAYFNRDKSKGAKGHEHLGASPILWLKQVEVAH